MAEAGGTEFWRDLKPIKQVFRPGAVPEAYVPDIATDDERYYAPLSETVGTRPVFISPGQNRWWPATWTSSSAELSAPASGVTPARCASMA